MKDVLIKVDVFFVFQLLASLVGMFESDTQIYSLTERYLFIPARSSKIDWLTHSQTKVGLVMIVFRPPMASLYFVGRVVFTFYH